jgi:hypothetical protein
MEGLMSKNSLPEQFKDLEPFIKWALATEGERVKMRVASTMGEIRAFYDAMLPRMKVVVPYLNEFPLEQMPEDAERLFYMTLSLAEVANAVELYDQPGVVDGFDPSGFVSVR